MRATRHLRVIVAACAALGLDACGFTADKNAAAAYAERYFAAAALDDVTAVLPLYSPGFFVATPRNSWVGVLEQLRERCGKPASHELESWLVTHNVGMNAGTRVKLVYDVHYARCRTRETLQIFRPAGGAFGIADHSLEMHEAAPAASERTTTV